MIKNIPYVKEIGTLSNGEIGVLNLITEHSSYLNLTQITRQFRRGTGNKKNVKYQQIIETIGKVECPIFGHPANAVPNIGSAYSTHFYNEKGEIEPYTIEKVIKRRIIYHNKSKI